MTGLFDTHAHLCDRQFSADRPAVLERAKAAGVERLVEIADAPAEWEAALALAQAHPAQARCSLGLHPYYAGEYSPALLERLESQLARPEAVAVGEIGLDYVKADVGRDVQLAAFEALLRFSKERDKPVVIHCRGAYEDLRDVLSRVFGRPRAAGYWGVVHCFSGGVEDALACRDLGFALGADGPVTYPKNDVLREALRRAGLSCLVLETDSPYLPPQSSRGRRNEPAAVAEIAGRLAEVFAVSAEELAAATTKNAETLYRL